MYAALSATARQVSRLVGPPPAMAGRPGRGKPRPYVAYWDTILNSYSLHFRRRQWTNDILELSGLA